MVDVVWQENKRLIFDLKQAQVRNQTSVNNFKSEIRSWCLPICRELSYFCCFLTCRYYLSADWIGSSHQRCSSMYPFLCGLASNISKAVESETLHPPMSDSITRPVGNTELTWCKAVPGGTGVTVLGLLFSKPPNIPFLQTALRNLQNSHPILRSRIHQDPSDNTYHFLIPTNPHIEITSFDLQSTSRIIANDSDDHNINSALHLIVEHELSQNPWHDPSDSLTPADTDVFFASTYTINDRYWAVFLRLHTAACDRTAAMAVLRELLALLEGKRTAAVLGNEDHIGMPIEDLVPKGKANKPFWARGVDVLGYSLNALRVANLSFVEANPPKCTKFVKFQLNKDETGRLIAGCKSRGIKLCGAIAAAGMSAVWISKHLPDDQREKYAVVTLIDCRSDLDPVLTSNHLGFYHSGILNTHDVCGERLWELAKRSYTAFENAKNKKKHFTDMSDLNFLMNKAIENPGLTPSSSLRTALMSVFEEPVIDDSNELMHQPLGLEDYVCCPSVHGVSPSIAIFDTIRDGSLNCVCVYPSPLHSREQMQDLVDHMKRLLVDGCNDEDQ
ncbi:uncharacterized protein LOC129307716 [Prosopis cineraria]|uniref:uncharacterized protein LOC129307716 n=1 Tax=Prosopis cineraria TaxID=364024 RepID=UPI002410A061|nr:uncharacterized protein LOC129307716 [Prosopis cineraria]